MSVAAMRMPLRRRGAPGWLRLGVPSWVVSAALHAGLVIALLLWLKPAVRGIPGAAGDGAPMALSTRIVEVETDFFEDEAHESDSEAVALDAGGPDSEALPSSPPLSIAGALPQQPSPVGTGDAPFAEATGVDGMTSGAPARTSPANGKARTSVFGLAAEGYKFVYVFDRSGSMAGSGRSSPLEAAKEQLLLSLGDLGDLHQFQIIFYNERPAVFDLAGSPGRLVLGNDQNKTIAERWVRGIVADGGTQHEQALTLALRMQPDAIFFLTDADQPVLTPAQLGRLRRLNRGGTSIHTIEFGLGPPLRDENFLKQLARENGGQHTYVDVLKPLAQR